VLDTVSDYMTRVFLAVRILFSKNTGLSFLFMVVIGIGILDVSEVLIFPKTQSRELNSGRKNLRKTFNVTIKILSCFKVLVGRSLSYGNVRRKKMTFLGLTSIVLFIDDHISGGFSK